MKTINTTTDTTYSSAKYYWNSSIKRFVPEVLLREKGADLEIIVDAELSEFDRENLLCDVIDAESGV